MKKPSITTITVRNLINVLLILSLFILIVTGYNFRSMSLKAIENQALAHAELVKAGLTAHMKAEIMDKRGYYLDELRELDQITELHVLRSEQVTEQYGPGKVWEKMAIDDVAQRAFTSREPIFIHNEWEWSPTVRVIIPYIASSSMDSLNCLACHQVQEGTVLGAVDIKLDVSEYRNQAALVISTLFVISLIALGLILFNTSRTISRHVQTPLEELIANAKTAYQKQQPLSLEHFATKEFSNVAGEFNLFNMEIIAHQDLLKQKNAELVDLNDEIEKTLCETVYTMGLIEEQRSKETKNHTKRVALYSQLLAQKLGLSEREVDLVTTASPLHDIGKLGVPDEILFKPGKLNEEERIIMQNHPTIGYAMLQHSKRDILVTASIIASQHHEKWDGKGYPKGLKGDKIHIFGRIISLADVFDALYSPRVYKEAWSLEKVVELLKEQRGKHFDPQLVDIFLANVDEFVAIYDQYPASAEGH